MVLRRSFGFLAALGALLLLGWTAPVQAFISLPLEPVPHKVAIADSVVVGKIIAVRPQPVSAQLYPHIETAKVDFVLVDVAVQEVLLGPRQEKACMGFINFKLQAGEYKPVPAVGQEGCFFGVKVGPMDYHVVPTGCFIEKGNTGYEQDLAVTRRCCQAMTQPDQWLKSQDPNDRLLAACMVVLRYTYAPIRWGGNLKGEPIDAEQSRLILTALAEAPWDGVPEMKLSPAKAVSWLRQGASQTGSSAFRTYPTGINGNAEGGAAERRWLHDHVQTYRIERLVWADAPAEAIVSITPDSSTTSQAATAPVAEATGQAGNGPVPPGGAGSSAAPAWERPTRIAGIAVAVLLSLAFLWIRCIRAKGGVSRDTRKTLPLRGPDVKR